MKPLDCHSQRGAVLFITLIMLLVLTLASVGGMREVSLEGRMTGNKLEQRRLMAAAESALRTGEGSIRGSSSALNACSSSASPCYVSTANTYTTNFATSTVYTGLDNATSLQRSARWYVRFISNSCRSGAGGSGNAYLSRRQSGCTYYYELNAQAYKGTGAARACGPDALCLRSTFALVIK